MSGLDVIESPAVRSVGYRGEVIEVRPLTVGQLPGFVRHAKPALAGLFSEGDADVTPEHVIGLIEAHGDALIQAAAVAVKRPAEWIAEGDPAEFVELVSAVIGVNLDFFARRLAPITARALNGAGRTLSSVSSPPATN